LGAGIGKMSGKCLENWSGWESERLLRIG
jgi:hypothetical protein